MKTTLKAGKLDILYENGSLRYISSGRTELLRMIYPAVRDDEWNTVTPVTLEEVIDRTDDSFRIKLIFLYRSGEINFRAKYLIEGKSDNSISFEMEGEALGTFRKNRIGLCVLHPAEECAGKNCTVEHTDGSVESSFFPEEINPHQVFLNVKSLKWMAGKINCTLSFEGDVFETEDQRNWTDASFKTYSTPLSLPFPSVITEGTVVHQKVVFRANNITCVEQVDNQINIIKLIPEESYILPSIGVSRSSSGSALTLQEIRILRTIGFNHYRTDIHLYSPDWIEIADLSLNESFELGCQMEIALFFSGEEVSRHATAFAEWMETRKPDIARILIFHRDAPSTPDDLATEVISILRKADPDAKIATGTNAGFVHINRFRPGNTENDYICYPVYPQEHASDNATLVENLKGQGYTVRSAKAFAGNKGVVISPVTLQRRFNTNISYMELPYRGEGIPPSVDPRLMTLFGACWTAGSLKYLGEADADTITYYETRGERGIIQGNEEPKWPGLLPSAKGMIFPVFHIFRFVLSHSNFNIIKSVSTNPLSVDCLSLANGKEARLIIVNFSGEPAQVRIEGLAGKFRMVSLDSSTTAEASADCRWTGNRHQKSFNPSDIINLNPVSVNFIECWLKG
ncbi:MAG TPA: hypothetical protein P5348_08965 [Bacteroidales bacterium]|mgnify:CR=1 FL=1|nr:hypothetical protein [Bacteroidales bacterium]